MFFFKKKQQNKTRLKTKFQYWYFVVLSMLFCKRTRSCGHKNRLSFICERARKAAKNSLMLKKIDLKKTNDPTKIRLGPQVKTTRPDPKLSSRLKSTSKVDSQVYFDCVCHPVWLEYEPVIPMVTQNKFATIEFLH